MVRLKSTASNAALLMASTVFALLVVEALGRWFSDWPEATFKRVQFMSKDTFRLTNSMVVTYSPDRTLRVVAVYGDATEFDVKMRTNNLGYLDTVDYPIYNTNQSIPRIAIVGDSFTAGFHGGDPWVIQLRQSLSDGLEIYNLGIGATGIPQFVDRIIDFSGEFEIDHIYIVTISHDFFRFRWRPIEYDGRLYFCEIKTNLDDCLRHKSRIVLIGQDDKEANFVDWAEALYPSEGAVSIGSYLSRNTYLGMMLAGNTNSLTFPKKVPRATVDSLDKLSGRFGAERITVMHVPQKEEAAAGKYFFDAKEFLQRWDFTYVNGLHACAFKKQDYFRRDPHLNSEGYKKLLNCVSGILR